MDYTGSARSSVAIGDLNGDGMLDIACACPADVSLSSVQASDIFLKLDGIKGQSVAENTSLSDITLTGGLSVTSSAVQQLAIDGIKGESIYMKLDNSSLQSRSSLSLANVDMNGQMDVATTGAIDIQASGGAAVQTSRASDFYLTFAALVGQTAPSSLSIDNWSLDGALNVTSVGGLTVAVGQGSSGAAGTVGSTGGLRATDMYMKISDAFGAAPLATNAALNDLVLSTLYLQTGAGDNTVSVTDSQVTSKVYLYGGLGNDSLVLDNTDFSLVSNPVEISWETMEMK